MFLDHLGSGRRQILECVAALVLGILDDACEWISAYIVTDTQRYHSPKSASLENLEVQRMKVLSSSSPEVTAQQRIVLVTLEYDSSGSELMTVYVMK